MKKFLERAPFYVFLIPLFFVLHGYLENAGYIHVGEALLLAGIYSLGAVLVFLLFLACYRRSVKAALAAAFFLSFYFFFGAIHDFLERHIPLAAKYSVLLPAFLIAGIALILFLNKTKRSFHRFQFFLNGLLIIYLVVDLAGVFIRSGQKDQDPTSALLNPIGNQSYKGNGGKGDRVNPDIYFLLFDAYTSSLALKEQYNYDNGDFDRFLLEEGFHIQARSRSNYKYTILSMPSIFNMSYLEGLKDIKGGPAKEYLYLSDLIRKNDLMSFLTARGYEIVNCSIFDLLGNPSPVDESLLPLKTKLITDQTLYSRFSRDIGWFFFRFIRNPLAEKEIDQSLANDNMLIDKVKKSSAAPSGRPRFIYGHFNMPHPPYFYDKMGNRKKGVAPYSPSDEDHVRDYLDYLSYTNRQAEEMIRVIKKNTRGKAVILLMGDHGLRYRDRLGYNPLFFLQNQNAAYFPDQDYHLFYDSISGVNQFRVVLNTLFKQNIPLLKDSTVNVKDKK
jgi:Sulfatase